MAKKFKLNIKNAQLAEAVNIGSLKDKLASKKTATKKAEPEATKKSAAPKKPAAKKAPAKAKPALKEEVAPKVQASEENVEEQVESQAPAVKLRSKTPEELAKKEPAEKPVKEEKKVVAPPVKEVVEEAKPVKEKPATPPPPKKIGGPPYGSGIRLGPTGRHINDILPPKKKKPVEKAPAANEKSSKADPQAKKGSQPPKNPGGESSNESGPKKKWTKEYKNIKPRSSLKPAPSRRSGIKDGSDEGNWRRKRHSKKMMIEEKEEIAIIRPKELSIRLPITVKALAQQMKLKASELISKMFMQGMTLTLNDSLDDETTVQLLGHEFECEISINSDEEERVRITELSIPEEVANSPAEELVARAPVITFMGHVDHGKTSLIDTIRKSNVTAHEAGAITQHIGAFSVDTSHGPLAILDTPGHEAFTAMRARGASVTDIVVLVVAGDEGFRQQTEEALQHAKAAGVVIVVAINKSDKPNFDADNVYRQLADRELLPESWGGTTITVNCSAKSGDGVNELLELLALQAEVLELKANPKARARGTVIESEMHKGLGASVSLLVQNGTLKKNDAFVFDQFYGRVKTMKDSSGKVIPSAGPSTPVMITGLSGLPEAGEEFIVVKSEREAKNISDARIEQQREKSHMKRAPISMDSFLQETEGSKKKLLLVLRADVQGSLEALKASIANIDSDKVDIEVVFSGVGEISESDVRLASASQAVILGFHTRVENHAAELIKETKVVVKTFDIIYHAIEGLREIMKGMLDFVEVEHEMGEAYVQATFKASQLGVIAGCLIKDGLIGRNHYARLFRNDEEIWKGKIASIKRERDDVKEVKKGLECGILLEGNNQIEEGDIIKSFEIERVAQEL